MERPRWCPRLRRSRACSRPPSPSRTRRSSTWRGCVRIRRRTCACASAFGRAAAPATRMSWTSKTGRRSGRATHLLSTTGSQWSATPRACCSSSGCSWTTAMRSSAAASPSATPTPLPHVAAASHSRPEC
eukprot:SM001638S02505  [mRNA]  locus=s1638:58:778:+ [translate_table: standard]